MCSQTAKQHQQRVSGECLCKEYDTGSGSLPDFLWSLGHSIRFVCEQTSRCDDIGLSLCQQHGYSTVYRHHVVLLLFRIILCRKLTLQSMYTNSSLYYGFMLGSIHLLDPCVLAAVTRIQLSLYQFLICMTAYIQSPHHFTVHTCCISDQQCKYKFQYNSRTQP